MKWCELREYKWNEYVTIAVNRNLSNCENSPKKSFSGLDGFESEATGSNPVEAPKSFFSGYFRNCLNCDSLRWSHTHFICIPAVHIISFSDTFLYYSKTDCLYNLFMPLWLKFFSEFLKSHRVNTHLPDFWANPDNNLRAKDATTNSKWILFFYLKLILQSVFYSGYFLNKLLQA